MGLVVFGYGNPSRGDDAIGPLLLHRIEQAGWPGLDLIEDFQLQLEHAMDLKGADLALFIDAGTGMPAPFSVSRVWPSDDVAHTSHAMAPEAVLGVYRRISGAEPPPAFLLCVAGEGFELGADMTPAGTANMEAAWGWLAAHLPGATPDSLLALA